MHNHFLRCCLLSSSKSLKTPAGEAIRLGLGHIAASPFTREELDALRQQWASFLPSNRMALTVPDRQSFLLGMIGQCLEVLGDPDFAIYMEGEDSFWRGVPVGYYIMTTPFRGSQRCSRRKRSHVPWTILSSAAWQTITSRCRQWQMTWRRSSERRNSCAECYPPRWAT